MQLLRAEIRKLLMEIDNVPVFHAARTPRNRIPRLRYETRSQRALWVNGLNRAAFLIPNAFVSIHKWLKIGEIVLRIYFVKFHKQGRLGV